MKFKDDGGFAKHKPKFDKKRCARCKYHAGSTADQGVLTRVICNYAAITQSSCLRRGPKGTVIDIRGDEYDNCKCFDGIR